jgi:hypothetical protein
MGNQGVMPIESTPEQMWVLLPDRRSLRMSLPDILVEGLREPLRIHTEFEGGVVDQIIERLTVLRAQMLSFGPGERN